MVANLIAAAPWISMSRKVEDDDQHHFKNRTRFLILILVTLCLSIVQSNVLTLNFTIICMNGPAENVSTSTTPSSLLLDLSTLSPIDGAEKSWTSTALEVEEEIRTGRYEYTPSQKNMLFSIVAIGAMVAVYPIMMLCGRFGTRSVCAFFGFFSGACTALLPLFALWGYGWMLAIRFLQGTALATGFTIIGICTRQWSMQVQNAFFIAIFTCFFQIGPIFTMPVAGALCTSSLGWPAVYYLHAIITFILYVLFVFFYREFPAKHRYVSEKELGRIYRNKADPSAQREPLPLRAMLTDNAVYACWIAAIGNFMGIQVTMQFSPIYLNKVLGFPVAQTGVFSSIPQICTFFLKIFAGVLADKAKCCSPVVSTKIFNCVAIGGMGLFFFALAWCPTSEPVLGLVLLICCCSIVGFNCGAFFRASTILAQQHNHMIMGVNSFINCASALIAPVVVNIFVANDTWDEWWYVWFTHGVILTVFNIYFCIFGKASPAKWTEKKVSQVRPVADPAPTVLSVSVTDEENNNDTKEDDDRDTPASRRMSRITIPKIDSEIVFPQPPPSPPPRAKRSP